MKSDLIKKIYVLSFGPALNVKGGISIIEKLIITHLPDNVSMKHIPTTIDGNKITKIFYFIYAVVRTFVNAPNYDIFHIHFASRGSTFRKIIICYIGLIFRKKIIMHAHGSEFHLFYNNIQDFYRKLIKSVFLKLDILISLSEKWMLYFKSTFEIENNKLIILHNPVKILIDDLSPKKELPMKLVFLGRIGKRKGAYDLINAIHKIINNKKIDIKLIMAGDGELKTAKSLVESLNIAEYIEVRDWVDEAYNSFLNKNEGIIHYNGINPWEQICWRYDIWWEKYRNSIYFDDKYYYEYYLRIQNPDLKFLSKKLFKSLLKKYFGKIKKKYFD